MFIIVIITVFCLLFIIDLKELLNTNQRKITLIVYFLLVTTGLSISLLQIVVDKPPSQAVYIEKMINVLLSGGKS